MEQFDPENRAKPLETFCICPFPRNPHPIIDDTECNYEKLRETAWRTVERIRHPLVRKFAIDNLESNAEIALPIFIMNYQKEDEEFLMEIVKAIIIIKFSIKRMRDYEYGVCSC